MFTFNYSITTLLAIGLLSFPAFSGSFLSSSPVTNSSALVLSLVMTQQNNNEVPNAHIRRAILTTAIENREPVDNLNEQAVASKTNKIYFFTEVLNKSGETITHRWFRSGRLEAEVVLKIGSDRWRTYSSKNLVVGLQGNWQVEVVDQSNRLLATQTFSY